MRWILESLEAVGHTSSSSAQVTVCSPVAEDHLSLKVLNGIFTSVKSEPTGTENRQSLAQTMMMCAHRWSYR